MERVAARQHPVARIGGRIAAGFVLVGLAALAAGYALPLAAANPGGRLILDSGGVAVLTAGGRLFVASGAVTAVLAMLLDRLIPIPSTALGRARKVGGGAPATDLSAAPEVIRELVAAARLRGYEVAAIAPWSKALVVHMSTPLALEDRQQLIEQFPMLGRWYFSGTPQTPPDEGFRDAESGVSISFPASADQTRAPTAERSPLQGLESAEGAELGSRVSSRFTRE